MPGTRVPVSTSCHSPRWISATRPRSQTHPQDQSLIPSPPARLGARRWGSRDGIVGPKVSRIAPLHLGLYHPPRSFPEPRKVARDLNGPLRGREQMQGERQLAVEDRRMLRHAEQLLHADVQGGSARRLVVDGMTIARRRLEVRRGLLLQAPFQVPWQQRLQRGAEVIRSDLRQLRLAGEEWSEPFGGRLSERRIGQVRPFVLGRRAQETNAVAE